MLNRFIVILILIFTVISCSDSKDSDQLKENNSCFDCETDDDQNDIADKEIEYRNFEASFYKPFAEVLFGMEQENDREFNFYKASVQLSLFLEEFSSVGFDVRKKNINKGELLIKALLPEINFEVIQFNSDKWHCLVYQVHFTEDWDVLKNKLKNCD